MRGLIVNAVQVTFAERLEPVDGVALDRPLEVAHDAVAEAVVPQNRPVVARPWEAPRAQRLFRLGTDNVGDGGSNAGAIRRAAAFAGKNATRRQDGSDISNDDNPHPAERSSGGEPDNI